MKLLLRLALVVARPAPERDVIHPLGAHLQRGFEFDPRFSRRLEFFFLEKFFRLGPPAFAGLGPCEKDLLAFRCKVGLPCPRAEAEWISLPAPLRLAGGAHHRQAGHPNQQDAWRADGFAR